MPITVNCDCGHQFRVRDEYAGKKAQCPACGDPVIIPASSFHPATLNEAQPEFPQAQMAAQPGPSTFPGALSGGGQWFAGLGAGVFGLGRLSGLACLVIGLVFVLLARGCDSLANRSAAATVAEYTLAQAEFDDEWEDKRNELNDKLERLNKDRDEADTPSKIDDIKQEIDDVEKDLTEHRDDEARARRNKERGEWKTLKRDARNAVANNTLNRFWRELLFVFGTVVLSIGLLAVGFTGEPHERKICLVIITIIAFSIYVGGVAWINSVTSSVPTSLK